MQNSFHLLENIIDLLFFLAYGASYGPTDGKEGTLAQLRQYNLPISISSYGLGGIEPLGLNRHGFPVLAHPIWRSGDANTGHGTR